MGFPVDPEVYKINNGSSASISSHGQSALAFCISSSHQRSRPSFISHSIPDSSPTRFTTIQVSTFSSICSDARAIAVSAFGFIGIAFAPRKVPFAVMSVLQVESTIRSANASAEKPPNTTEWIAPIRAQASIATVASTTIGI